MNEIYGRSQQYRYFLNFEPVAMAGYSIYIYHITLDEANRVRREMGLPELPGGAGSEERDRCDMNNKARPQEPVNPWFLAEFCCWTMVCWRGCLPGSMARRYRRTSSW